LNGYLISTTVYFALFFLFVNGYLEWINNRITIFLGMISYSLYVIHQYLIVGVIAVLRDKLGWPFVWAAITALAIAFIIASLITFYIEKPALHYFRSLYKSKKVSY